MNAKIIENQPETVEVKEYKVEKTIASCNAVEFLMQTAKIKDEIAAFLKNTDIFGKIRKGISEKYSGVKSKDLDNAGKKNLTTGIINEVLNICLKEHAEDTAKILGLLCFIEPKDIEKYKGVDFLMPAVEIIQSETCMRFFRWLISSEVSQFLS